MQIWLPAVITLFVQVVLAAVVIGSVRQVTREHERRLNVNDEEHTEMQGEIGTIRERLSNLRGQLGLNGG